MRFLLYAGLLLSVTVFVTFLPSCGNNPNSPSNNPTPTPTPYPPVVEVSNQYGGSCPVIVNLDGNNAVTIAGGTFYTFPTINPGSHTLNFSTNGNCVGACTFSNNNSTAFSDTFTAADGIISVATVRQGGSNCNVLIESEP